MQQRTDISMEDHDQTRAADVVVVAPLHSTRREKEGVVLCGAIAGFAATEDPPYHLFDALPGGSQEEKAERSVCQTPPPHQHRRSKYIVARTTKGGARQLRLEEEENSPVPMYQTPPRRLRSSSSSSSLNYGGHNNNNGNDYYGKPPNVKQAWIEERMSKRRRDGDSESCNHRHHQPSPEEHQPWFLRLTDAELEAAFSRIECEIFANLDCLGRGG